MSYNTSSDNKSDSGNSDAKIIKQECLKIWKERGRLSKQDVVLRIIKLFEKFNCKNKQLTEEIEIIKQKCLKMLGNKNYQYYTDILDDNDNENNIDMQNEEDIKKQALLMHVLKVFEKY